MSRVFRSFDTSESANRTEAKPQDHIIKKGQLQIAPYHKYVPRIKTTNNTFNPTNSNHQIKDYYNFKPGYPNFNKKLTEIYENNDYREVEVQAQGQAQDKSREVESDLLNQLWSHRLPDPVRVRVDEETQDWCLDFELPFKSKIFSDVRPDLPNTCFTLKEKQDLHKETHAYVVLYFPSGDPKNSYLLPTLLVGWMLKHHPQNWSRKQNGLTGTAATTICLITPEVTLQERELLLKFYDRLVEAPYITWNRELEAPKILIRDLSKGAIPSGHVYDRVTTKLWIFDSERFPYEKVVLLDSDLFPLGYFDSLFNIDTPAGWLEHQRRQLSNLGISSWISDRGTRLRHGEPIPADLTETGTLHASDLNASLLVIKPDKELFQRMMADLQSEVQPSQQTNTDTCEGAWAGDKYYPFYLLPEQNYLTNYFSGQWHSLDLGFSTWCLDLEHAFGFTFAGFSVKPWTYQSLGQKYSLNPYSRFSQINNQETNRSLGLQYFNLLLVKMLQNLPANLRKEVSQLVNLNLLDHPFDPWEPEIDLKAYRDLRPLLSYALEYPYGKEQFLKLTPDQLLLAYTILATTTNVPSDLKDRTFTAIRFENLAHKMQPLGVVALNYVYLKLALQMLKGSPLFDHNQINLSDTCFPYYSCLGINQHDFYLSSPTVFNWLPLEQKSLQIKLKKSLWNRTTLLPLLKNVLSSGSFRVFIHSRDPEVGIGRNYQIVDGSKNLPLDYFCQLKPPEVEFLTIEELETNFTSIDPQSFNFSLSEPVWQELQLKVGSLEVGKEQNLLFGHNHYGWRPNFEFTFSDSPFPRYSMGQYLDYVNEFVQVVNPTALESYHWSSLFVHLFRKEIGELYQTILDLLRSFLS